MRERLKQSDINKLYEMMHILHTLFERFDIRYTVMAGTLLGATRDKGLILADDDIDIAIFEEDETKLVQLIPFMSKWNLQLTASDPLFRTIYRLSAVDGQKICKQLLGPFKGCVDFTFPFIDIFVLQYSKKDDSYRFKDFVNRFMFPKEWFRPKNLFPLQLVKFGPLKVYAPRNATPYLNRTYGDDWCKVKRGGYDHSKLRYVKENKKITTYEHEVPTNVDDWKVAFTIRNGSGSRSETPGRSVLQPYGSSSIYNPLMYNNGMYNGL